MTEFENRERLLDQFNAAKDPAESITAAYAMTCSRWPDRRAFIVGFCTECGKVFFTNGEERELNHCSAVLLWRVLGQIWERVNQCPCNKNSSYFYVAFAKLLPLGAKASERELKLWEFVDALYV